MTTKVFVDRSRYETAQKCMRARYLEYHFGGMGVQSARKPLPLAVGGSVHASLAELLRLGQDISNKALMPNGSFDWPGLAVWIKIEDDAVAGALADFAQYKDSLDAEIAAAETPATLPEPTGDPVLDSMLDQSGTRRPTQSNFDDYLYAEQSALVEALVRAYARRRLRPLLEQFEVLEVEREGEWLLTHVSPNDHEDIRGGTLNTYGPYDIVFMSRPDALLRERESNQLYLLSYKTTGSWDVRKARDAEHDMQGLSEGIEIERRLAEWWNLIHATNGYPRLRDPEQMSEDKIPDAMFGFLKELDGPPRIFAVRMEYLLKGERWKDKDLTERFGVEMQSQKSHLIRQYVAASTPQRGTAGYSIGDTCWSWEYVRDDGRDSHLAWQNWKSRPVWDQPGGIRTWIDKLDDAAPTMSGEDTTMALEPRLLGYKCDAQAVGLTRAHPLDAVFLPPMVIYRHDDDLRDLVEQMEAEERRIAEGVAAVNAASDEAEVRHALNINFPQSRRSCIYPSQCQFVMICYGGEDIRRDPVASGKYKVRQPNHLQERQP
jgi:hypothetical protein